MTLDKVTVCKMTAGEVSVDKMARSNTLNKMSVVDKIVQNDFRQNDSMQNACR